MHKLDFIIYDNYNTTIKTILIFMLIAQLYKTWPSLPEKTH